MSCILGKIDSGAVFIGPDFRIFAIECSKDVFTVLGIDLK